MGLSWVPLWGNWWLSWWQDRNYLMTYIHSEQIGLKFKNHQCDHTIKTCHNLLVAISDEMILWYLIDSCIQFYGDHSYCSASHWRAVLGPISLPLYLGWTANIVNETINSERGNSTPAYLSHGTLPPDSPKKTNVRAKQSACRTSDHLVPSLPQTSIGMHVCVHTITIVV